MEQNMDEERWTDLKKVDSLIRMLRVSNRVFDKDFSDVTVSYNKLGEQSDLKDNDAYIGLRYCLQNKGENLGEIRIENKIGTIKKFNGKFENLSSCYSFIGGSHESTEAKYTVIPSNWQEDTGMMTDLTPTRRDPALIDTIPLGVPFPHDYNTEKRQLKVYHAKDEAAEGVIDRIYDAVQLDLAIAEVACTLNELKFNNLSQTGIVSKLKRTNLPKLKLREAAEFVINHVYGDLEECRSKVRKLSYSCIEARRDSCKLHDNGKCPESCPMIISEKYPFSI